jgi:tetratricopeptide (TPR) repeat protein
VEQVLLLLPDVDALAPLRAYLMATSRRSAEGEALATVGKRLVRARDLPELVPRAMRRVTEHLEALYAEAIAALEAEELGDSAASVAAFLRAGLREARAGREAAARRWYEHALRVSEGARVRTPEIDALQHLAALEAEAGERDRAARLQQRALVLANAEGETSRAIQAAHALGHLALERNNPRGAAAWFSRGFEEAGAHPTLAGRLALGMSALELSLGSLGDAARWIDRATEHFADVDVQEERVELLRARAHLAARSEHFAEALALNQEALVRLREVGMPPRAEIAVRLEIAQLFLLAGRLPDAEDELRRTEELAIVSNASRDLSRVYIRLGEVRARQRDESGFVFFENAIELSRLGEPSPRLEAQAYLEYANFRAALGDGEEARAYIERAREILEGAADPQLARAVDAAAERHAAP